MSPQETFSCILSTKKLYKQVGGCLKVLNLDRARQIILLAETARRIEEFLVSKQNN